MISTDQPSIDTNSLGRFLRTAQRKVRITGEVNVLITSNAEMCRLNRQFRGKSKPTDVLSFPASQNGRQKITGDIAISTQIARATAESLGHSLEIELKILLLHGLLHLAGHDHEADNGKMAQLEQQLRAELGLPIGLIERTNANVNPAAPGRGLDRTRVGTSSKGNSAKQPAGSEEIHVSRRRSSAPSVSSVVKRAVRSRP